MPPHYCKACGWPVEYCQFRSRKLQEEFGCEKALKAESEEEWRKYWGWRQEASAEGTEGAEEAECMLDTPQAIVAEITAQEDIPEVEAAPADEEGEEEAEEEAPVSNTGFRYDPAVVPPFGNPVKPFERRKADRPKILQIRVANRGGRKSVTQIYNLEDFSVDQNAYMAALRKSCAAAVAPSTAGPGMADILVLQGNFREEAAREAVHMGVPRDCIFFAPNATFKGRKRK